MKKSLVFFIIIILSIFMVSCSSSNKDNVELVISGDIESFSNTINFDDLEASDYTYTSDDKEIETDAYCLGYVLENVTPLSTDNWILITGEDNVSARIDFVSANLCYVIIDDGKLNIETSDLPTLTKIKDIKEITIISKSEIDSGIKIVEVDDFSYISYGNAKLALFEQIAENSKNGNVAYKHTLKTSTSISELTECEDNILYFENFDIEKADTSGILFWENSGLCYQNNDQIFYNIFGVVTGTDTLTYDAFYEMQTAIDNDEKVMFILPDGFSYEQVEYYNEDLSYLSENYVRAATVNPAISNVSLASIITGLSPYETGIYERCIADPNGDDIFDYALSKGKTVSYIEGNGNLLLTNIEQTYSMPDEDGYTDSAVFDNAMSALESDPDLIFVHFHGIDDVNHEYSPISQQAEDKILETENYIKILAENFDGKIIIVPDHGHITYLDENNELKGYHGKFETNDMYVPYYIIDAGD
jgi:hypothetical protein